MTHLPSVSLICDSFPYSHPHSHSQSFSLQMWHFNLQASALATANRLTQKPKEPRHERPAENSPQEGENFPGRLSLFGKCSLYFRTLFVPLTWAGFFGIISRGKLHQQRQMQFQDSDSDSDFALGVNSFPDSPLLQRRKAGSENAFPSALELTVYCV